MSAGRTHRTHLARAFAQAQSVPYQKALAHVIACSEAGLLPPRLDQAGMEQALTILRQHLGMPTATEPEAAPTEPKTAALSLSPVAKRPSLTADPRCIALSEALVPVLRATSPAGAGGYGGALQANLHPTDALALGGVPLIRAALRRAARQLGWRVQTLGYQGKHVALVLVHDTRQEPAEFAAALEEHRQRARAEAAERASAFLGRNSSEGLRELGSSPVERQTQTFLEAVQAAMSAAPEAWRQMQSVQQQPGATR
ncbi:hypothetical protein [Streptomyces sp. NBC_00859]|uniref:hypothetical protein n=1 Tax=Streptomyces sp. NBC_00859 TaxID=2903682 RepID=UPI00386347B6|nr:hypothetical protein OG584_00195 [Streptomyces sp. NBC_00859]WSZ86758.1 hypothetical protein OG584_34945 [Streptomyces sp. NBC_00859]